MAGSTFRQLGIALFIATAGCPAGNIGTMGTCDGVTCSGHGTCSVQTGTALCACDVGYHAQATSCLSDADPCAGQTCSGHGTCSATGTSAACTCETSYHRGATDPLSCVAGSATGLAWMAPTTNADGTPLRDLAGYKLHYDTTGRGTNARYVYQHVVDIGMPFCAAASAGGTECQFDTPDLTGAAGTKYFLAVTGYDRATPPNESAYSNEIMVTK